MVTNNKVLKLLCAVLAILAVCSATPGAVKTVTGNVSNGICLQELVDTTYNRLGEKVRIPSAVILADGETFVMGNMNCKQFSAKKTVNAFTHTHPYYTTYSILVFAALFAILIAYPIASLCGWIDRKLARHC